jgi:hypothetical protein
LKTSARALILAPAAAFLLAMMFPMSSASAGQSTNSTAIKQVVPYNPADHTPPAQPLPYSHKIHLAIGLQCASCHTNPAPGNLMTFPAIATCMSCHHAIATKKPAIQKLTSYAKSRQPVPWIRVYRVLPGVTWTHKKHLDAGMKCEMCHGQVSEMETMNEATSVTSMGVCIKCHMQNNAPTVCATCHAWPAENVNP